MFEDCGNWFLGLKSHIIAPSKRFSGVKTVGRSLVAWGVSFAQHLLVSTWETTSHGLNSYNLPSGASCLQKLPLREKGYMEKHGVYSKQTACTVLGVYYTTFTAATPV